MRAVWARIFFANALRRTTQLTRPLFCCFEPTIDLLILIAATMHPRLALKCQWSVVMATARGTEGCCPSFLTHVLGGFDKEIESITRYTMASLARPYRLQVYGLQRAPRTLQHGRCQPIAGPSSAHDTH
jgi:hypothetical protein